MNWDANENGYDRFEEVRRDLVERSLPNSDSGDNLGSASASRMRRGLLEDITRAAVNYAREAGVSVKDFEYDLLPNALYVVENLEYALTSDSNEGFWTHDPDPMRRIVDDNIPTIWRENLEAAATDYLNLPYRSLLIERVMVDALIAAELYAYGSEMVTKPTHLVRWLRTRSPLHQRHALLGYLKSQFWSAVVLIGLAVLAAKILPSLTGQTVTDWTVGILLGLFVIVFVLETALMPVVWWYQRKDRMKVKELVRRMLATYSELDTTAAISTRRVREVATTAAEAGVVWPSPLFALLDDNIGRLGRL